MNRIKKVSQFFKIIFQLIFIALPILLIVSWYYAPTELVTLYGFVHMDAIPANYRKALLHTLSTNEKMLGFLVSTIPMMVYLYILYTLIKLFSLYEKGEIFSIQPVRHIRNVGYALLATQMIEPFYEFAMGIVLTMHNPPGHRFASITMNQNNVGILLTALMVLLISWIMLEACQLKDDQRLTI